MECGSFLEWHQQFSPTVRELGQCQLGCEHNHGEQQKNHLVQPGNKQRTNYPKDEMFWESIQARPKNCNLCCFTMKIFNIENNGGMKIWLLKMFVKDVMSHFILHNLWFRSLDLQEYCWASGGKQQRRWPEIEALCFYKWQTLVSQVPGSWSRKKFNRPRILETIY